MRRVREALQAGSASSYAANQLAALFNSVSLQAQVRGRPITSKVTGGLAGPRSYLSQQKDQMFARWPTQDCHPSSAPPRDDAWAHHALASHGQAASASSLKAPGGQPPGEAVGAMDTEVWGCGEGDQAKHGYDTAAGSGVQPFSCI